MITPVLPTYARADLEFEKGEGSYLLTALGERYLDFGAGIAVNVLGHANPGLVAALNEQAQKVWHTSNIYRIPGQERLAQRPSPIRSSSPIRAQRRWNARSRWRANITR